MKKTIALLLCAALALSVLVSGCGKKEEANDDKTFTVGFDAEFPPYGYKDADSDEYVGFDLDLAEEVCKRNGWALVKQSIDWDSKDMELVSGSIDCSWNGFSVTGREDKYTWTEPYLDNSQVVIVKKDSGIESLSDLEGRKVMVQADSSALAALEGDQKELAETFGSLEQIADYNSAFMNLESGAVEAVALDYGVAQGYLNSNEDFVMLDEVISTEQYAVGFKLGNEELRDQVQKTLDEMAEDGTIMKIAEKYSDYDIPNMLLIGK